MTSRLLRGESRGCEFALVFAVSVGDGWREASVLVTIVAGYPRYGFPHRRSESGESLGTDEADAALLDRAKQFVDAREAGRHWDAFVQRERG